MGHTASSCRGKIRCNLCGKGHSQTECPVAKELDRHYCVNCHGTHKSNSKDCPIYQTAKKIEVVRVKENLPYKEAREKILSYTNDVQTKEHKSKTFTNTIIKTNQLSYRNALVNNYSSQREVSHNCNPVKVNAATQTNQIKETMLNASSHEDFFKSSCDDAFSIVSLI